MISVVVPAYRSTATLGSLVERLAPVLRRSAPTFELILVDDGSGDGTWEAIAALAAAHSWVRGLRLMRNFGQHNATLCGIRAAAGEVIVTLDDDLQNPPEEIPRLLERIAAGYDVVYGTPREARHGFWRGVATRIAKSGMRLVMGIERAHEVSAYRAFRASLRDGFAAFHGPEVSIDALLSWSAGRFTWVEVEQQPRASGRSRYSARRLVAHTLNVITGFTAVPLRLASLVGFGFTLFGFAILAYVFGRLLWSGRAVPGFAFLASIIAIFSGAQLFALGIFGEYLARVHFRTMGRPVYVVAEETRRGA